MKTYQSVNELKEAVERNNFYYRNNFYDNYASLKNEAVEHFKNITSEMEDQEGYYKEFGLKIDEVFEDRVKQETFYIDDQNLTVSVSYYEFYIDSGVPAESYFYGYIIIEN